MGIGLWKILIFDFDGVLADSLDDMLQYAREVCAQLGHACDPTPANLEALDIMSFAELGRQLGVPDHQIEVFIQRVFKLFISGERPPKIIPGLEYILVQLAQKHKISIVTGNTSAFVRPFLDRYGLLDCVEIILDVNDPGSRAEKILKVTNDLNGHTQRVYMIGDAVSDIWAAHQAGVKSLAVSWGHQSREKLMSANPDFLVDSPQELFALLDKD